MLGKLELKFSLQRKIMRLEYVVWGSTVINPRQYAFCTSVDREDKVETQIPRGRAHIFWFLDQYSVLTMH